MLEAQCAFTIIILSHIHVSRFYLFNHMWDEIRNFEEVILNRCVFL